MSTAPTTNGHSPMVEPSVLSPSVLSEIERHARELDELLSPLRAERDQLKARLSELGVREKAIAHAIGALRGGNPPAPAPAKEQKKTKAKDAHDWQPSEERLKRVFDLMLLETAPISPTQLAKKTERLSVETASKSLKILRERELVRVAAVVRGGGSSYAIMPGAEWPES